MFNKPEMQVKVHYGNGEINEYQMKILVQAIIEGMINAGLISGTKL